jgi:hypothetical protein
MLVDVCSYIADNYSKNSIEYFLQTDDESNHSTDELINLIRDKLMAEFGSNIQITDIDNDDKISIKFVYNEVSGELSETYDSRGNLYWVVDFVVSY